MNSGKKRRDAVSPELPDTQEEVRAIFQELKGSGKLRPERLEELEKMMARMERLIQFAQNALQTQPKLATAINGSIDEEAQSIIGAIYLSRNTRLVEQCSTSILIPENEKDWYDKFYDKIASSDPLFESHKNRVLKAVCDLDKAFLQSLIDAIDVHEASAIHNSTLFKVMYCHHFYEQVENKNPTNRELLTSITKFWPGTEIDERTLRYLCKREGLSLAPSKRGRPRL